MKKGIHYEESFSPCTRLETIRFMAAIAAQKGWKLTHADVPNAYLNGKLDRLIFTHLPLYWNEFMGDELGKDGDIVVLDQALYGAPNAGRAWNNVINAYLIEIGFKPCPNEPALYYHPNGTIIALWVDDLFMTGPSSEHIRNILFLLKEKFQIKDLGRISYALGIHFRHGDDGSIFLSQTTYIDDIVMKFGLSHARPLNILH